MTTASPIQAQSRRSVKSRCGPSLVKARVKGSLYPPTARMPFSPAALSRTLHDRRTPERFRLNPLGGAPLERWTRKRVAHIPTATQRRRTDNLCATKTDKLIRYRQG